jgi:F-type H+-transporting ATPase subunit delta
VSDTGIARPYATALFEAATAAGSVAPTGDDLREFVRALGASPSLANAIFNPQVKPEAKARVLAALTSDGDRLAAGVLRVLLKKGRFALVGEVADQYERFVARAAKVVEVEVTTAKPVGAEVESLIVERVRRSTGGEPRLTKRVDPEILGGLVLRVEDLLVDGSLRARIQQLDDRLRTADVRGGDK